MPCKHVVATIWDMSLNDQQVAIPERWVHPCYWLKTWKSMYDFKVNPINGRNGWPKSTCPAILTPPKHHTQVGRPKKKRRKSQEEISDRLVQGGKVTRAGISGKCNKCGFFGHNSRTCTGPTDGGASDSKKRAAKDGATSSQAGKDGAASSQAARKGKGKVME